MKLYASDGVFMPQHSPSSIGADAVRKAYDAVFRTIKLTVKFNVTVQALRTLGWTNAEQ
jgi:ketosteroid isomerase-like protein